jgi:sugar phosphate isomerase/epimerase
MLMRDFSNGLEHLSLNTATVRKQLGLEDIIEACAKRGIFTISPWREQVHAAGITAIARHLKEAGVCLSGYCRGGFFPAPDAAGLGAALADNRVAVDEAKALNAPCLIIVAGSLPGALAGNPSSHDIDLARCQVMDGLAATLEYARAAALPLAIEPLHPMQAAERACINTLRQALDICDALDPGRTGGVGIALDVYHTWWDPELATQIARAGKDRLLAYHICDWLVPTRDILNDRGMMGDGVIELRKVRALVEAAGYGGCAEIEIFSNLWWSRPAETVLDVCIERFQTVA